MQERKIHTSFHDLSPSEYMYFPKGTLETEKPGRFSKTELQHLFIAMIILTIAFSFVFSPIYSFSISRFLSALPISFLGILTAFFVHELSHKFMAQKYGLWSEFRMNLQNLFLSLFFALFTGFVFAAPGAVMFQGQARTFETGMIASAGPSANIITAVVTYSLSSVFFDTNIGGINIGSVIIFICFINSFLAFFNLFPIWHLDGSKIIRWNGIVWASLFIVSILLLVLNLQRGISFPA
jgi:Zn-dependent protease